MSADQLRPQTLDHVVEVEVAAVVGYLRVEQNLQQQVG